MKILKVNSPQDVLKKCKSLGTDLENYKKFYDSLSKAIKECSPE